ncbi:MAG TPA: permease-like cell division protein FtsX, partial [Nitrospirota bacterium]|nr:permease-like cell division protein FtsX [Nitrospirota bacterium]
MILFEGLRGALSQIVYNRYTMAAAVGIISIIFLVSGMFLLTLYNLNLLAETLKSDMEVIAYFKSNVSPDRLQRIRDDVSGFREVGAITYISKEHAIEILSRDMVSIREMVQELRENPLPDSFRISLTQGARTPEGINALVNRLKEIKEIQKVDYGEEWVERLNVLIATAKIIGVIVGGILLLVVLFIVSNTIKFTLLTRHKEIEIMKFVGATNLFIRVPFIIEGGFLGLISAIVSIGMLFFTYKLI